MTPLARELMAAERAKKRRFAFWTAMVWLGILICMAVAFHLVRYDVQFMWDKLGFLLKGIGVTLYISAISIIIAVFLALLGALGRLSKNPLANGIASFYVSFIRGTPLLVQIFLVYLGVAQIGRTLQKDYGMQTLGGLLILPGVVAGIAALSINYGAYMTEIFRAGIQSISKGQTEAAYALGMTPAQTLRRIILPQAIRVVIPPIGNEFIAMIKDSSLVSVTGAVWDLTFRAQKLGRQYFKSLEMLTVAALIYWVMCITLQGLQGQLEEYMARGERK